MSAAIIDGNRQSEALRARVAEGVRALAGQGVTPGLAVVLVGQDAASAVYVRNKSARTVEAGMRSFDHKLPAEASEAEVLALVRQLNADEAVDGILVQLPLPPHIDSAKVLLAIDPAKDVDGFHPVNAGRLATGQPALVPCTPLGCVILAKSVGRDLAGMEAVVVGRSNIVGKPVAQLLLAESCTVTVAHSKTRDLAETCRRADLLVAAVGRPEIIGGDWVKLGAGWHSVEAGWRSPGVLTFRVDGGTELTIDNPHAGQVVNEVQLFVPADTAGKNGRLCVDALAAGLDPIPAVAPLR